jgi:uncharacterized cupin superfamily protein
MTEKRHDRVANVDEVEAMTRENGRFASSIRTLGGKTGTVAIGCNYFEVAPGKTAFPHHYHCGIEEALFVIEGSGEVRIGEDRVAVRGGDFIALPAGPEHAHQLINTSDAPLRYLCISNRARADVVGYPDSGKIAAMAASDPARWFETTTVRSIFFEDAQVGYFDGEDAGDAKD